jgi:hypothetical protein
MVCILLNSVSLGEISVENSSLAEEKSQEDMNKAFSVTMHLRSGSKGPSSSANPGAEQKNRCELRPWQHP